jgi:hypothetical protein
VATHLVGILMRVKNVRAPPRSEHIEQEISVDIVAIHE